MSQRFKQSPRFLTFACFGVVVKTGEPPFCTYTVTNYMGINKPTREILDMYLSSGFPQKN